MAVFLTSPLFDFPHMRHAFFTRQGGVSTGVYAELNGGVGSREELARVVHNRALMAQALGVAPTHLLVPYQIHSADVVIVHEPWAEDARPRADALVTNVPDLAVGVTGADCGMILFGDADARVIGAAHAGWKGALTGVIENTLAAMESLGAQRSQIHMALGPMIAQCSYEGPEFVTRFDEADHDYMRFFRPSERQGYSMFNLPAFIAARAHAAGITHIHDCACDTYSDEARFYSYRRSVHRAEDDYGRLVSAIVIAP
jgi:polyphenol oxidase